MTRTTMAALDTNTRVRFAWPSGMAVYGEHKMRGATGHVAGPAIDGDKLYPVRFRRLRSLRQASAIVTAIPDGYGDDVMIVHRDHLHRA